MTLRMGDISRGIAAALAANDIQLFRDCGQILESMKQYQEAASLYERAKQYEKAAGIYLQSNSQYFCNSFSQKLECSFSSYG